MDDIVAFKLWKVRMRKSPVDVWPSPISFNIATLLLQDLFHITYFMF